MLGFATVLKVVFPLVPVKQAVFLKAQVPSISFSLSAYNCKNLKFNSFGPILITGGLRNKVQGKAIWDLQSPYFFFNIYILYIIFLLVPPHPPPFFFF